MEVFGLSHQYRMELETRFQEAVPNGPALLDEIVRLRGRVAFYEERIRQMVDVMNRPA